MQTAEYHLAIEETELPPEVQARIDVYLDEIKEVEARAGNATPSEAVNILFDYYKPKALVDNAEQAKDEDHKEVSHPEQARKKRQAPEAPSDYREYTFRRRARRLGLSALGNCTTALMSRSRLAT